MQVGQKLERLAPVHPQARLAAQRAAGLEPERLNAVGGHLGILGIEREDAFEVVRVPGGYPLPAERGEIGRRVVLALHGFLRFSRFALYKPPDRLLGILGTN